jgi:acyl-CoA synthetase (AMP-forming)/AMP-acid ligase II
MYPGAFAETDPDKPATIMAATGATLSYGDLDQEANRVSRLLRRCGVEVGDHVALCLENHERFLPLVWGCRYAGAIFTPLSSRLKTDEMDYIINNCGATVFCTSASMRVQAEELLGRTPGVTHRFMLDGVAERHAALEEALGAESPEPLRQRIAGHDMLYSSGTTGRPKGVKQWRPNEPLETADHPVARMQVLLFGQSVESVYLSPAPLYHAAPLRFSMGCHVIGSTLVIMDSFDPPAFLDAVEDYRITHTQMVPTMFVRLLKLPEGVRLSADLSSLEAVVHAAAPCPIPVKQQMIDWLGPIVHEYYAGTEANGIVYCDSPMWLDHPGTVGQPINCQVHICAEDGAELPTGAEGLVYFGGGGEFEYHLDPQLTAGALHPEGWSTLGDIGRVDGDGYLYLTDRKSYMIITGGVNVYPQEAEDVLTMHPSVADVAVIGVPDPEFGEQVKAIVQAAPGAAPGPDLERELIDYCRDRLAHVKCPRSVDFRDRLPRHPTGKLYKRLLKDEYWGRHDAPSAAPGGPVL